MRLCFLRPVILSVIAAVSLLFGFTTTAAAETTQCTAITKTPTVISRPGHYCFKKDLRFAPLDGTAIDVRVGNVLLDMNGYYLRGDVSAESSAVGILVRNKPNVRVANGTLTHFGSGLVAIAASGLLVENMNITNSKIFAVRFERTKASVIRDSRFLNNLLERSSGSAIFIERSDGTRVQNNDFNNTGIPNNATGNGDLTVDAIIATAGSGDGESVLIENNRITSTAQSAITVSGEVRAIIQGNIVVNAEIGVDVDVITPTISRDNTFVSVVRNRLPFEAASDFVDGGGNVLVPPLN